MTKRERYNAMMREAAIDAIVSPRLFNEKDRSPEFSRLLSSFLPINPDGYKALARLDTP